MPVFRHDTEGDGLIHTVDSFGLRADGLYEVTVICASATLAGAPLSNGFTLVIDGVETLWMMPDSNLTFQTAAVGRTGYRDAAGAPATFLMFFHPPYVVTVPA